MTFVLDGSESVRIQVLETDRGIFIGFRLPDDMSIPTRIKFSNRTLDFRLHTDLRIVILDSFIMGALGWKEGDELCWKVYSDRTNFFKKDTT